MRAWNHVAESQSSAEFTGALLGTAIGCALSAAFRPYSNAIGEETAERLVMLKRIKDFPTAQEQREQILEQRERGAKALAFQRAVRTFRKIPVHSKLLRGDSAHDWIGTAMLPWKEQIMGLSGAVSR